QDGVEVAEGPASIEDRTAAGSTLHLSRVVDASGHPVATVQIDRSGLQLRFLARSERAWLGVDLQPIPDVLAQHLELDADEVALVASVRPSSPAEHADVQPNDIVVAVGGRDRADPDTL